MVTVKQFYRIGLFYLLFLLAFTAEGKPCSLQDFQALTIKPQFSAIYVSKDFNHPVRFSLQYIASKKEFHGSYANSMLVKSIIFSGPAMKEGKMILEAHKSYGSIDKLELSFSDTKNTQYHEYTSGCEKITGYEYTKNHIKRHLILIFNGLNDPQNEKIQTQNERAAIRLKRAAKSMSINELSKLFDYPALICRLFHPNHNIILKSSSDVKKYYSKIMTHTERQFIDRSVPFNLNTDRVSSVFAQRTIYLQHGLIGAMCIQQGFYVAQVSPCNNCF